MKGEVVTPVHHLKVRLGSSVLFTSTQATQPQIRAQLQSAWCTCVNCDYPRESVLHGGSTLIVMGAGGDDRPVRQGEWEIAVIPVGEGASE